MRDLPKIRFCCVGTTYWFTADDNGSERCRNNVPSRVTTWVGVDANERAYLDDEPSLFKDLPAERCFNGFTIFHKSAW
jgi:hypothetical protein